MQKYKPHERKTEKNQHCTVNHQTACDKAMERTLTAAGGQESCLSTVTPEVHALAVKIKDAAWLNSKSKHKPKKDNSLFKMLTDIQAGRKKMENGTPAKLHEV